MTNPYSDVQRDLNSKLDGRTLNDLDLRRARLACARAARSAAELRHYLDVLGLLDDPGAALTVDAPL